jgi:hypothetical protein
MNSHLIKIIEQYIIYKCPYLLELSNRTILLRTDLNYYSQPLLNRAKIKFGSYYVYVYFL